jgi:hypothetical protein
MKKLILFTSVAAALVGFAGVATAQVTGTVGVTGTVTTKCVVVSGNTSSGVFGGTITLGELDQSNGTLNTTLSGSSSASPAGNTVQVQINCNSATPKVDLKATRLTDSVAEVGNESSTIDYTAETQLKLAGGGTTLVDYTTAAALPADTVTTLTGPLSNTANDVTVEVFGLTADNGASSVLTAGTYNSTVTVVISPS